MKLLLAGLLMALVLVSEVVGLVALARYSASTEAHPPEQGSFTVVSAQGDDGNYQWQLSVGGVGGFLLRRVGGPEGG
jgi:hypothetical protein